MGPACGIAGSPRPEEQGVFLCSDEYEASYFVDMNNTGGPVDVWAVEGVSEDNLVESGTGYRYLPWRIPSDNLTLVRASVRSEGWASRTSHSGPTSAYQSSITITLDNGTDVRDAEAHELIRRALPDPESAE